MDLTDLVKLRSLMDRTAGIPDIKIGLIDGPVSTIHPDLAGVRIQETPGRAGGGCTRTDSPACLHGTFVAGILSARRGSAAPALCPGCTLVLFPVFGEASPGSEEMPSATSESLADSVIAAVDAGARVINMSVGLTSDSAKGRAKVDEAINYAAARGVLCVAAAGNQGLDGGTTVSRHPWIIPVAACDGNGRPVTESAFGRSIGERGLLAPGVRVTSLEAGGETMVRGGTSAAAPFVTAAIALLWSEVPDARAALLKLAITQTDTRPRRTLIPPLLNGEASFQTVVRSRLRRAAI